MRSYKLIMLGDGGVGKSAITLRFVQARFEEEYVPTIEDAYRNLKDVDGKSCRLEIIDTAGTEQFRAMRDIYMKDGDGFILVYDITDPASYEDVKDLPQKIGRTREAQNLAAETAMILVGNKVDLQHLRAITKSQGQSFAMANNCEFIESSAKTDFNIDDIFTKIVREINRISKEKKETTEQGCKCRLM